MEHIEADIVIGLEEVENGGQDVQRKASAVHWGRGDGLGEVLAHAGEEHIYAWRLDDKVDQKIVRSSELFLRCAVERNRCGYELLESIILLVLIEEGLNIGSDVQVFSQFLGQIGERPVNKDLRCRGRHIVEVYGDTVDFVFDGVDFLTIEIWKPHFAVGGPAASVTLSPFRTWVVVVQGTRSENEGLLEG